MISLPPHRRHNIADTHLLVRMEYDEMAANPAATDTKSGTG